MKSKKHVHRSYSTEFKLSVLRDMYANNLSYYFTAKKYDILSPQTIVKWIKEFPLDSKSLSLSQEVITKVMSMRTKNELKKAAECPSSNKTEAQKLQEENALLRKALEYSELRNEALMEVLKIGKEEYGLDLLKSWRQAVGSLYLGHGGKLSLKVLSGLFGKTREGYYSVSKEKLLQRELRESSIVEMTSEIRGQAPGIGARKLFLILKDIYPEKMVGRDRFYKLLYKHHLMLLPQRRRHTTNSNHNYRKYKNCARDFKPTRPNQLWVADITYIDTDEGVCYLHLLTDAFTHEIIGWVLSDTLMATSTIEALNQGISQAGDIDLRGLIHHSDRGSQYCCNAYVDILNGIGATISMTEDYKPTDNAIAERVNGIIKQEWLYRMKRPEGMEEAGKVIADIVDFYNNKRPHMSNGMLTPKAMRRKYEQAT